MSYLHITPNQKNELAVLLRAKVQKKDIAKILNKHISSIYRELKGIKLTTEMGMMLDWLKHIPTKEDLMLIAGLERLIITNGYKNI